MFVQLPIQQLTVAPDPRRSWRAASISDKVDRQRTGVDIRVPRGERHAPTVDAVMILQRRDVVARLLHRPAGVAELPERTHQAHHDARRASHLF